MTSPPVSEPKEPKGTQTGDQLLDNNVGLIALGGIALLGGAVLLVTRLRRREH